VPGARGPQEAGHREFPALPGASALPPPCCGEPSGQAPWPEDGADTCNHQKESGSDWKAFFAEVIGKPQAVETDIEGAREGGEEFPGVVSIHTGIALQCRFRGQAFAWEALTFAEQFSDPAQQFGIGACLPA
jgi:hypothetical protein